MSWADWVEIVVPSEANRRARADLRALAASLEEHGYASLPVGSARRRRRGDAEAGRRAVRNRVFRPRAWPAVVDGVSERLAVTPRGELLVVAKVLFTSGAPVRPGLPVEQLAGHGPGVLFLSFAEQGIQFGQAAVGPPVGVVRILGWGYEYHEQFALDQLIAQTMDAYAEDPHWHLRPHARG
ncbi:hypothetical protein [Actinoplanes sp. NPDC051859]|uniref:hypothetical protein n=1 Tax=Actinoplanes sp. NPDC051859 TaxID=3363909 RepID=UPI0037940545